MEYILNAAQMKLCDKKTIETIGISSMVLMERAALSVVNAMVDQQFDLSSVLVLCGSGNNGGDGFAIARILDERKIPVVTAFVGNDTSMTEETKWQRKICETCGIKNVSNFKDYEYTTIVDAILGIGLSREVQGKYAEVFEWVNSRDAKVVSVDIPSGICADTGKCLGSAIRADLTVTFAYKKTGQILYPGTEYCGTLIRTDIGILANRFTDPIPKQFIYNKDDLRKVPCRKAYSNKGTYGKVLLIAGTEGMSGAACLAGLAAYRSGCGLVRIFTPACNRTVIQTYLPEAIVTVYQEDDWQPFLMEALDWADVTGIGPGIGQSRVSDQILQTVMKQFQKTLVVDADALNLLSKNLQILKNRKERVIVTPHVGEMMRLMHASKEQILADIILAAKQFAAEYGVICVLKDARSIVSDGENVYINISGNSGMSAGGSGDVLTGVICALLAQHMEAYEAAALGVYLHGLAGDFAAKEKGAYGMLASELADGIGEVLKNVR